MMTRKPVTAMQIMHSMKVRKFGIPNREFPFVATNAEEIRIVNDEMGLLIESVTPMIDMFIRKSRIYPIINQEDVEDIMQETRIHLCVKSLPKYNAIKPNKHTNKPTALCTFVYICIKNCVSSKMKALENRMTKNPAYSFSFLRNGEAVSLDMESKSDWVQYDRIYSLAEEIIKHPTKYFDNPKHAELFGAMMRRKRNHHYAIMQKLKCSEVKALRVYNDIIRRLLECLGENRD